MNRRQKKKRWKRYQKGFCERSTNYEWQCPKCGWDSLAADEEIKLGKILWRIGDFSNYSFEVEYKCPICGDVFRYIDGS